MATEKSGSKATQVLRAAVLTVSDGCSAGRREDLSGRALVERLARDGWAILEHRTVPDERSEIVDGINGWLIRLSPPDLIVSTGGTGLSPRDVTPEAVFPLLDKQIPGLSELMRLRGLEQTPRAALSRSLAGIAGGTLVLCLPGSPKGAVESLEAALPLLRHAIDIAQGRTRH